MIKNLTVRDFRGIAEGTIEDFAKVNIFVGPNNSGKTTILEALYLATTADVGCSLLSETGDSFPVQVASDYDMLGHQPMVRIWQRHNFPPRWPNAPARWKQLGYQIEFFGMPDVLQAYKALEEKQTKGGFVAGDEQLIALLRLQRERNPNWQEPEEEEPEEEGVEEPEEDSPKREPKYYPLPPVIKTYLDAEAEVETREDERRYVLLWHPPLTFDFCGVAGWHIDVEGQVPTATHTLLFDFHTTLHHFSQSFIDRGYKIVRYWQRRLGEHMARVFDLPKDPIPYVSFSPYLTDPSLSDVLIDQYGRMVSIDTWGDGARHAMKLLVTLIFLHDSVELLDQPGIVLWEDPELFLHPKALHRLMREVLTLIKDLPIQLFITTQSLEAVASLTTLVQEMALPTDMLRAFRQKRDHGKLVLSPFSIDNLDMWLESGLDPRYWHQGDQLLTYQSGGEE